MVPFLFLYNTYTNKYILNNMNSLQNYIYESLDNDLIMESGFWKKVGELLGFGTKKLGSAVKSWSNDLKQGFTTGQYLAAKSKDKNIKKAAKDETIGAEKSPEERHNALSKVANDFSKYDFSNYSDNDLGFVYYVYANLNLLSENLNKLNGKKIADLLKQQLEKYKVFDKAKKLYENTYLPKVEKSGQADQLGNDNKENIESKDNSTLGISNDGETTTVSPEQETNAIKNEIKDDNDFFAPLAKAAGIDGKQLVETIKSFINKSWKHIEQDDKGNAVLKWNKEFSNTMGLKGDNFDEVAVKGVAAIVCGVCILNHKSLTQNLIDKINPNALRAKDILAFASK